MGPILKICCLLILASFTVGQDDDIQRLNAGVYLRFERSVTVVTDEILQILHLQLPNDHPHPNDFTAKYSCDPSLFGVTKTNTSCLCTDDCLKRRSLFPSMNRLQDTMDESLSRMITFIYQNLPQYRPVSRSVSGRRRNPRGIFNAICDLSRYLFGTSTTADVDKLHSAIQKLGGQIDQVSTVSSDAQDLDLHLINVTREFRILMRLCIFSGRKWVICTLN